MYLCRQFLKHFVNDGSLTLIDTSGATYRFGHGNPQVTIRIADPAWPGQLVRNPALAVGEGYMHRAFTLEQGDVRDLAELCIRNKRWGRDHWLLRGMSRAERGGKWLYQYNPVSRARKNVARHYELSVEFFDLFLDRQRQYSCGYFHSEKDELDRAQEQKLGHIAAKLCLEPGMTVLDVGCGWGGLALYLARHFDVRVTGITLSNEQLLIARDEARRQGVEDRVKFLLLDYRQVEARYDRVVSVGMFEHVGRDHYRRFFRQLRRRLKPDGVCLLHSIGRADGPGVTNAWTRRYIFPGGYSPALSEVIPAVERERLFVTDIEILRLHYAETIRCWLQRFMAHREQARKLYDATFCRMWEFYLAASEASFRWGNLMVFQVQLARDVGAVSLTRDYIGSVERALLEQRDMSRRPQSLRQAQH